MKQQHAVIVLFVLIVVSGLTSFGSYKMTDSRVSNDMKQALALTMAEQQSNVISQDTIRKVNSHLQIAELRGKVTLAVDARGQQFKAYAKCSEATVFSLSDQRPATLLWALTGCWAMFLCYRRRLTPSSEIHCPQKGESFGGLTFSETDSRFYAADGNLVQLTPMQHQLMEMFFRSPNHTLTKTEICDALWPKKPDANDTLYTLVRRLKPVVERYSKLKIESDRSKAYRLTIKKIENRQGNVGVMSDNCQEESLGVSPSLHTFAAKNASKV